MCLSADTLRHWRTLLDAEVQNDGHEYIYGLTIAAAWVESPLLDGCYRLQIQTSWVQRSDDPNVTQGAVTLDDGFEKH